jgi:magnesium-transporting ATPase (P-type)
MAAQENPHNAEAPAAAPEKRESSGWSIFQKIAAVVYTLFCFEVGAFLVMFPWHPLWSQNFFAGFSPGWREIWSNPYVRGAVSGLGVVNIVIAVSESLRLRGR